MQRPQTAHSRASSSGSVVSTSQCFLLQPSDPSSFPDDLSTLPQVEGRIHYNITHSDILSRYFSNEKAKERNEMIKGRYLQSLVKISETEALEENYKAINEKYSCLENAFHDMKRTNEQLLQSLREAENTISRLKRGEGLSQTDGKAGTDQGKAIGSLWRIFSELDMVQIPPDKANELSECELVQLAAFNLVAQYKRLKQDADGRKSFSTESEAHIDNLQRQIVKIELELVESRNIAASLERECERLSQANAGVISLQSQISQQDQILKEKATLIDTLQKQVMVLQEEKTDADQRLFLARAEADSAAMKLAEKNHVVEKLNNKLTRLKSSSQAVIEQRDQEAVELAQAATDMRAKFDGIIQERQKAVENVQRELDALRRKTEENARTQQAEMESVRTAYEESISTKNARISQLLEELAGTKAEQSKTHTELDEVRTQLLAEQRNSEQTQAALEDQLTKVKDERMKVQTELEKLRDEHSRQVHDLEQANQKLVSESTAAIQERDSEILRLKLEVEGRDGQIATLSEQGASYTRTFKEELERTRQTSESLLSEKMSLINKLTSEMAQMRLKHSEELAERETQVQELTAKTQTLVEELARASTNGSSELQKMMLLVETTRRDLSERLDNSQEQMRIASAEYKENLARLEALAAEKDERIAKLSADIKTLRGEAAQAKSAHLIEIDGLVKELSMAKESMAMSLTSAQEEISRMGRELDLAKSTASLSNADSSKRVQQLSQQIVSLTSELAELRGERDILQQELDRERDTHIALSQKAETIAKERMDALQQALERTQGELNGALTEKLAQAAESARVIDELRHELVAKERQLAAEGGSNKMQIKQLESQLSVLTQQREGDIARLTRDASEVETRLGQAIQAKDETIGGLTRELEETKHFLQQAQDTIGLLQSTKERELSATRTNADHTIALLNDRINTLQADLASTKAEMDEAISYKDQQVKQLSKQLEDQVQYNNELSAANKAEVRRLQQTIDMAASSHEAAQLDADNRASSMRKEFEEVRRRLLGDLEERESTIEGMKREITALRRELLNTTETKDETVTRLRTELEQSQAQLMSVREQKDAALSAIRNEFTDYKREAISVRDDQETRIANLAGELAATRKRMEQLEEDSRMEAMNMSTVSKKAQADLTAIIDQRQKELDNLRHELQTNKEEHETKCLRFQRELDELLTSKKGLVAQLAEMKQELLNVTNDKDLQLKKADREYRALQEASRLAEEERKRLDLEHEHALSEIKEQYEGIIAKKDDAIKGLNTKNRELYNDSVAAQSEKTDEIVRIKSELKRANDEHLEVVTENNRRIQELEATVTGLQRELRSLDATKRESDVLNKRETAEAAARHGSEIAQRDQKIETLQREVFSLKESVQRLTRMKEDEVLQLTSELEQGRKEANEIREENSRIVEKLRGELANAQAQHAQQLDLKEQELGALKLALSQTKTTMADSLQEKCSEIENLTRALTTYQARADNAISPHQYDKLSTTLTQREGEITSLNAALEQRNDEVQELLQTIADMRHSTTEQKESPRDQELIQAQERIKSLEHDLEELRALHDFIQAHEVDRKLEEIKNIPETEDSRFLRSLLKENGYLKHRLNELSLGQALGQESGASSLTESLPRSGRGSRLRKTQQ
ncbi:hypothetical protein GMRT_11771 [Giardia muris]|uniref:Coiled-coil protein n=1 Tax=Giardia muris TaxID=5742 RepID=A0A4Z1T094_GIAMU|nr:hypothetical protein GMRT_11771 [Giardia muris]|eukprot:TNJ29118.1 hypothetical protein GMRT_11771 [Giardia muris]